MGKLCINLSKCTYKLWQLRQLLNLVGISFNYNSISMPNPMSSLHPIACPSHLKSLPQTPSTAIPGPHLAQLLCLVATHSNYCISIPKPMHSPYPQTPPLVFILCPILSLHLIPQSYSHPFTLGSSSNFLPPLLPTHINTKTYALTLSANLPSLHLIPNPHPHSHPQPSPFPQSPSFTLSPVLPSTISICIPIVHLIPIPIRILIPIPIRIPSPWAAPRSGWRPGRAPPACAQS